MKDNDIHLTAHITWDEEERQTLMRQIAELNEQLEKAAALADRLGVDGDIVISTNVERALRK